ncbi:MAG: hypothetical protein AB9856_21075 [Cellulosilyticaceae bacterium]
MILDKEIYKKIEYYFYNYEQECEALEMMEEDIIWGSKTEMIGGSRGNQISNKTERSALKLADPKQQETKIWLQVVDAVMNKFKDTEYEKIIKFTYEEQYKLPKILRLITMEKSAYYDRRNDIIIYAALKATERGLVTH